MRYFFCAFLIVLLLPSTAQAQATGSMAGKVVEARTGETMPGVNIIITSLNRGAATDVDGNYVITGLAPGTYEIIARFIGFKDNRQTITLSAGQDLVHNFSMGRRPAAARRDRRYRAGGKRRETQALGQRRCAQHPRHRRGPGGLGRSALARACGRVHGARPIGPAGPGCVDQLSGHHQRLRQPNAPSSTSTGSGSITTPAPA